LSVAIGDDLLQVARLAAQLLDFVGGGGTRRVTGEPLLAGFEELLRPVVIEALGDAFTPTQGGDRVLAAKSVRYSRGLAAVLCAIKTIPS